MDMKEEEISTSNYYKIEIRESDALALMKLLVKRGYFHENVIPVRSDTSQFLYKPEENHISKQSSINHKDEASLVETTNKSYIMINILRERFAEELRTRGRLLVSDAAEIFGVSTEMLLRRVVPFLIGQNRQTDQFISVTAPNGFVKELLLVTYFEEHTKQLFNMLRDNSENGWMLVSDAAKTVYRLPIDVTLTELEKLVDYNKFDSFAVKILVMDNGSKVLVTTKHLETIKQKLEVALGDSCNAPIDIKVLSKSNKWEVNWTLRIIQEGLHVPGEFRGETYIPNRYIEEKRNLVSTSYATNGYVTSHMCYTMFDITPLQMKEYATNNKCEESYVILPNSVINKDMIIMPLLESARAASDAKCWLDLQLHVPIDLLEYETNDAQILINTYILSEVQGVACVRSDGALLFSQAMVQNFTKKRLVSAVHGFGISRANEIYMAYRDRDIISQSDNMESYDSSLNGKEKRTNRKFTKSPLQQGIESMLHEKGPFPFQLLEQLLTEDHPDLVELESSPHVLAETCKLAFFTDELEVIWCGAIQTELQRLCSNDTNTSLSTSLQKSDLNLYGFHSIEVAFEDPGCFATCCYMIQAKAKFLTYAIDCTERVTTEMEQELRRDFFAGCCREFVYRVTQYTLYRNKIDDDVFSFATRDNTQTIFYSPIDTCSSSYIATHFSCKSNQRDALTALEEELPRSIGVSLARTWELCDSGYNHKGSNTPSNDVPEATIDGFLEHLRENCLTYCGLPLANFDKKAEKKMLTARRLELISRLEMAETMTDLLDITIMLLYQLVKNQIVSGPLLRGPILDMLLTERKLTETMASELRALSSMVDEGKGLHESAIDRVKVLITLKSKAQ